MSFITILAGSKLAVGALTLGTLAAGGTAAAAYTGSLPSSLQESAHTLIGAPAPAGAVTTDTTTTTDTTASTPSVTPVGPDATGPAAFGLCNAYMHGGLSASSTAYASLATAALGAATAAGGTATIADSTTITTYCATITKPGKSAAHLPTNAPANAHATSAGKSAAHRSTTDGTASSDITSQTGAQLSTDAGAGSAHKPAKDGRP